MKKVFFIICFLIAACGPTKEEDISAVDVSTVNDIPIVDTISTPEPKASLDNEAELRAAINNTTDGNPEIKQAILNLMDALNKIDAEEAAKKNNLK